MVDNCSIKVVPGVMTLESHGGVLDKSTAKCIPGTYDLHFLLSFCFLLVLFDGMKKFPAPLI